MSILRFKEGVREGGRGGGEEGTRSEKANARGEMRTRDDLRETPHEPGVFERGRSMHAGAMQEEEGRQTHVSDTSQASTARQSSPWIVNCRVSAGQSKTRPSVSPRASQGLTLLKSECIAAARSNRSLQLKSGRGVVSQKGGEMSAWRRNIHDHAVSDCEERASAWGRLLKQRTQHLPRGKTTPSIMGSARNGFRPHYTKVKELKEETYHEAPYAGAKDPKIQHQQEN